MLFVSLQDYAEGKETDSGTRGNRTPGDPQGPLVGDGAHLRDGTDREPEVTVIVAPVDIGGKEVHVPRVARVVRTGGRGPVEAIGTGTNEIGAVLLAGGPGCDGACSCTWAPATANVTICMFSK